MRSLNRALLATLAAGTLAGCSGNYIAAPSHAPVSVIPPQLRPTHFQRVLNAVRPSRKRRHIQHGIYAAGVDSSDVFAYKGINQENAPPYCVVPTFDTNGISVDGQGDLLVPSTEGENVGVLPGPDLCGGYATSFYTSPGLPVDAASNNAMTGPIAVAMYGIYGTSGGVGVCTVSAGCTTLLTNASIPIVVAVAMALNGDCWANGSTTTTGPGTLVYFKGCSGGGQVASGFQGSPFGGIDIDRHGNIVAVELNGPLYVYKGCNPVCKLVGGPFGLFGGAIYGKVNKQSDLLATGDFEYGQIDIYYYTPTGIDYEYSITNGLSESDEVEGTAWAPRSRE